MKRLPTEVALLRLTVGFDDVALALPKLPIMTVNELLCGFNSRFVIDTFQADGSDEMAVNADHIDPILGHRTNGPTQPECARLHTFKVAMVHF
jgi:hypothetical protein